MCTKPSCSAKLSPQIRPMQNKLETLSKSPDGKESLAAFEDAIRGVWYDLAEGEAISSTIYALSFDHDLKQKVEHLKIARRNFYISCEATGVNELEKCQAAEKKNVYLSRSETYFP